MKSYHFNTLSALAKRFNLELVCALFNARHIAGQVAVLQGRNAGGDTFTAYRFRCMGPGAPADTVFEFIPDGQTRIPKECILSTTPTSPPLATHYEWLCPGCGDSTHGDAGRDSIFEIRNDPRCVYCRVRAGDLRFNGSKFERVAA